jgi:uncharacterized membrane protein
MNNLLEHLCCPEKMQVRPCYFFFIFLPFLAVLAFFFAIIKNKKKLYLTIALIRDLGFAPGRQ